MKRRLIDLGGQAALMDIASYGRTAPRSLTVAQRAQIARTVGRAPEVMVKVSGGPRTLNGVGAHLAYIGRDDFEVETDMGDRAPEKGFEKTLLEDWDLDLEVHWHQSEHAVNAPRRTPKLVHNIIFSMPPSTDRNKVLQAVRKLAVDEWALKHRYAMVLHTNEAHPHVHVVVKARSEQGERLNMRKATLRNWRARFAENLRELGVAANATERAVRGKPNFNLPVGIYRAAKRHESTFLKKRVATVYNELRRPANRTPDKGGAKLLAIRRAAEPGWRDVSLMLAAEGDRELAQQVQRFVEHMPPARTDREIVARYWQRATDLNRPREEPRTR